MGTADLKAKAEELLAARGHPCGCTKSERQPKQEIRGAFVVTICGRCGGYTRPKE